MSRRAWTVALVTVIVNIFIWLLCPDVYRRISARWDDILGIFCHGEPGWVRIRP